MISKRQFMLLTWVVTTTANVVATMMLSPTTPTTRNVHWIMISTVFLQNINASFAFNVYPSTRDFKHKIRQPPLASFRTFMYTENQDEENNGEINENQDNNDFLMAKIRNYNDIFNKGKVANGDFSSAPSEMTSHPYTSKSLTPNYILYPHFFSSSPSILLQNQSIFVDAMSCVEEEIATGEEVEALSFPFALQKMIQSLKNLLEEDTLCNEQLLRLKLGIMNNEEWPLSSSSSPTEENTNANVRYYTIQIQQKISHSVDALCWIHANQPRIDAYTNTAFSGGGGSGGSVPPSSLIQPCIMYMCNAENTFEAAAIGEAVGIGDLSQEECWDMIRSLPYGSGLYGGRRFDVDGDIGEEWKDFGKEMWVLPLLELRLEK